MKLYYSLRSPFARRVRSTLLRLEVPFEPCEINVFEPTEEFLKINPLGLVPAIEWGCKLKLADSAAILEYIHDYYGEKVWPLDRAERTQVRSASVWAEGVMTMTVSLFLEKQRKDNLSQEWLDDFQGSIRRTLDLIDSTDLDTFPWSEEDCPTQAGRDLVIALEYLDLRAPELNWKNGYPKLKNFLWKYRDLPELRATQPPAV